MKFEKRTKIKIPLGILLSMVHLQKLTAVLGTDIKCAIIQFIFYTPGVADFQRTLRESGIRPVVNLSIRSPAVDE